MTDDNICGGEKENGEPCRRDPGWGLKGVTEGPCRDHIGNFHNPKKLTPDVKSTLIGAAQEGAFKQHCAQLAGISEQTLRNWINWGEEDIEKGIDSPCAGLYSEFMRARGAGAVNRLKDADTEFVLERSYGYTKSEKHELEHSGGLAQEHSLADEDRETALEAIRSMQRSTGAGHSDE